MKEKKICELCKRRIWFWQERTIYPNQIYVNKDIHLKCLIEEINDFGGCEKCGERVSKDNFSIVIGEDKFRKIHFYHSLCKKEVRNLGILETII